MSLFYKALVAVFILATQCTNAQEVFSPSSDRLSIVGKRVDKELVIDGVLDEVEWNAADSVSAFIQIEPHQGLASLNRTVVKVLYNDEYLYVGALCFDSLGRSAIRVPDLKRDFNWKSHDTFAICIDGFNDRRNSMSFVTNPYGAQKDYLSFDDILFDSDWNSLWKVRTSISEYGWFAEFQIPWKTLRYSKALKHPASWGINFLRLRRASNEISAWSAYPRSFGFNRMEYSGEIVELDPPPPSTNIQVNPYSLVSANKRTVENVPVSEAYAVKAGGDIKWAVNTNTILDVTVNTDFAQADADVQVNNVSRFSVLFPEKRQFFLENASLFSPGVGPVDGIGGDMQILPFFSRRIGLDNEGRRLPIDGGLRFVNRSVKRNIGVMAIRQGSYDTLLSSNLLVGRFSQNLGRQNRIGAIATLRDNNTNTNVVSGIDGFIRSGSSHSVNFMALRSGNTHDPGNGYGGYIQYFYTTNKVIAWLTQSIATKDFNPELGFLSRTDVIGTTPGAVGNLRGKYLPLKKYIRSYKPTVMMAWYHQASTGRLIEREINIAPFWIEMQHGGHYAFSIIDSYQHLTSSFSPVGVTISPGIYKYRRYSIQSGSDPSRKISYTLKYNFGNYYSGALRSLDISISVIPLPHISLKASLNRNEFENVGDMSGNNAISLYTLQGMFALNPRIQLVGLYQKASHKNLDSYNLRFAWEYRPLSFIYIVVNSREHISDAIKQTEQQGIIKVSYLKQF